MRWFEGSGPVRLGFGTGVDDEAGLWLWPALHARLYPCVRVEKTGAVKRLAFRLYLAWLRGWIETEADFPAPSFVSRMVRPLRPMS
jgi:hypothetical protein